MNAKLKDRALVPVKKSLPTGKNLEFLDKVRAEMNQQLEEIFNESVKLLKTKLRNHITSLMNHSSEILGNYFFEWENEIEIWKQNCLDFEFHVQKFYNIEK